ncbi:hypothetical protein niasHT_013990 [Heterodera trifolii]|uniref:Uncharacterized protein n=1 Tax=Heterodera trifolii TaxID=157864 RepID=A0ABD2KLB4_9BILA
MTSPPKLGPSVNQIVPSSCCGIIREVIHNRITSQLMAIDVFLYGEESYQRFFPHQIDSSVNLMELVEGTWVQTMGFRAKTSANEWPTSSDGIRDWWAEQIYVGTNLKIFGDDEHEDDHQWPQNEQFRMSYRYLCAAMDSLQAPKRR